MKVINFERSKNIKELIANKLNEYLINKNLDLYYDIESDLYELIDLYNENNANVKQQINETDIQNYKKWLKDASVRN